MQQSMYSQVPLLCYRFHSSNLPFNEGEGKEGEVGVEIVHAKWGQSTRVSLRCRNNRPVIIPEGYLDNEDSP
jgi:hypothetical protein